MSGHGGAIPSPSRSRASVAVAGLLVAASLVPSVSAFASAGDDGSGDPSTSAPPSSSPPTTTAAVATASTVAEATTTPTTPPTTPPSTTAAPTTTSPPTTPTPTNAANTANGQAATAATTAAGPCPVTRALRRRDQGAGVLCLERRLVRRGHDLVGPDQWFDATTQAAVRRFQQRNNILVTGVAGPMTLAKLGIWGGVRIDVPCSVGYVVRRHMHNAAARCVEQRLIRIGYDVNGPDRFFDRTAAVATQAFQRRAGIAIANGAAGPWTLHRLGIWSGPSLTVACTVSRPVLVGTRGMPARCLEQRLIRVGYPLQRPDWTFDAAAVGFLKRYQSSHGISPNGRAAKYVLTALGIWKQPPRVRCEVGRTVRAGSTGRPAQCVERKLVAIGYALYGPDRNFDATSVEAVRAYQQSKGLTVDGIAGPFTLYSLGIWAGSNPYGPPPLPNNSGTGRRVVYSRAQQRVWAVEADGRVVKTHLVSGRLYEPYAGTYSVYSRSMYTYSVKDPNVKWRYMVRFAYGPEGGRIGFHEIPTRFGVPLQSESQLGQPLSGGCVRQRTSDAIWMWNWAYLGTKVVVL
jgi:peptidoglycan hydrolase-like protein with peptidoglycan-binding domain